MTEASTLKIDTVIDHSTSHVTFHLSGEMDVTAGTAFAQLDSSQPMRKAILDFTHVTRVNSMGLAQLLRLLEQWRCQRISMEACNMNRTISMLFKMTGMNRYFSENVTAQNIAPLNHSAPPSSTNGLITPASGLNGGNPRMPATARPAPANRAAPPQLRRVARNTPPPAVATASTPTSKMTFSVSLQSNQQLTGWYYLNTLLQRALDRPIAMSINQLGANTELAKQALVFAKPFDACALMTKHHFLPVVQPQDDTDEVSIIVRQTDQGKSITDFPQAKVITAVETNFVFLLGRFFCDEYGLDSAQLQYAFTGNEITALKALLNGNADMLFMLKKNYHQLSRLSREATHVLNESETGLAYHMLLIAPEYQALRPQLTQALLDLSQHDKGAQVLNDLGIQGWNVPKDDEINMLLMLYHRYVAA